MVDEFSHKDFWEFMRKITNVFEDEENTEGTYFHKVDNIEELCPEILNNSGFNDKLKVNIVCKEPKCGWFVYYKNLHTEPTMKLRKFDSKYTCKTNTDGKNLIANAKWVVVEIEQDTRNHKMYKPRDIKTETWEIYEVKLTY